MKGDIDELLVIEPDEFYAMGKTVTEETGITSDDTLAYFDAIFDEMSIRGYKLPEEKDTLTKEERDLFAKKMSIDTTVEVFEETKNRASRKGIIILLATVAITMVSVLLTIFQRR